MVDVWKGSREMFSLFLNPLASAEKAACSCVSKIVDKMAGFLNLSLYRLHILHDILYSG